MNKQIPTISTQNLTIDLDERHPVKCFEGLYEVSSNGDVYRAAGGHGDVVGRKLNPRLNNSGYFFITLYRNNVGKNKTIHRIVADSWIPNPDNLPQVNHINGIKTDNRVENLEWCDRSYQMKHAYRVLGIVHPRKCKPKAEGTGTPQRPVRGTHLKTGEQREFEGIHEAARQVGGNGSNIWAACQGKQKSSYGYHWQYLNERKD